MGTSVAVAQVVVALSVFFVWVVRLSNVEREFREYQLPDLVRNLVGAIKIAAATLLVAGLWFPALVFPAAVTMGGFMLCAQYFHFSVRHPLVKYLPSFALLALCGFVAASAYGAAN
jgi:hypothetical protein